jgi:hypothetical protein
MCTRAAKSKPTVTAAKQLSLHGDSSWHPFGQLRSSFRRHAVGNRLANCGPSFRRHAVGNRLAKCGHLSGDTQLATVWPTAAHLPETRSWHTLAQLRSRCLCQIPQKFKDSWWCSGHPILDSPINLATNSQRALNSLVILGP